MHQAVQSRTNQAETKESALFVFFTRLGDDKVFEQVTRFEGHLAFFINVSFALWTTFKMT